MTEPVHEAFSAAAGALRHAAATLGELSPAQLADLAAGRARLVFQVVDTGYDTPVAASGESVTLPRARVPRRAAAAPPNPEVVGVAVQSIRAMQTPGEVAEHLRVHRYPVPVLRQIARELGPTVSLAARDRAGLERNIVEGTAGYLARSAAMSGGAWS
jgi:hypothetical protein